MGRLLALIALVIFSPVFLITALAIVIDSKGNPFYIQNRVGKNGSTFGLVKFRTMLPFSDKAGKLTVGSRDSRITRVGYFLRKYKIDELPQFINVLKGEMAWVGPRPEVPEYVSLYTDDQRRVLTVKPGITDYASIHFFNESDLIAQSANPEKTYVEKIMPEKIGMNLHYIDRKSTVEDLKIVMLTLKKILS
ncbi:MAG TPA: sugar transferase [Cryomorphaceae bacterium]|nr:sugar transferase [Cryomorphaceae bacterium]